ncbi:hypothetical protein ULB03_16840 [Nitrospirillum sp. BR 11828]|nr:hypothetical protein [Nitrospirillum sp. BR 11828]MDZ5648782.1 hypothetical protein [Nitrospirillum sp. BR 11828]
MNATQPYDQTPELGPELGEDPSQAAAASLLAAGRADAAWMLCRPVLAAGLRTPSWLALAGRALLALDRPAEAEPVLALAAGTAGVAEATTLGLFTLWGVALRRLGRVPQAEPVLRMAVRLSPTDALCRSNLAAVLRRLDRLGEAEDEVRVALDLAPDLVNAHVNLASILMARGDFHGALSASRRALAGDGTQAEALYTQAAALQALGDVAAAADAWAAGVAAHPQDARLVFGRANLDLARGALAAGWAGYEARRTADPQRFRPPAGLPPWRGQRLDGPLLIWREQGLGDELMFASCYGAAIAAAGSAVVRCDPRLTGLFGRAFPDAQVVAQTPVAEAPALAEGAAVAQVAAGSLPALLRGRLAEFGAVAPVEGGGYLRALPDVVAGWRRRLAALDEGGPVTLKVGLCWRSGLDVESRAGRQPDLADWTPLLALPGVTVVTLMYVDTGGSARPWGPRPPITFPIWTSAMTWKGWRPCCPRWIWWSPCRRRRGNWRARWACRCGGWPGNWMSLAWARPAGPGSRPCASSARVPATAGMSSVTWRGRSRAAWGHAPRRRTARCRTAQSAPRPSAGARFVDNASGGVTQGVRTLGVGADVFRTARPVADDAQRFQQGTALVAVQVGQQQVVHGLAQGLQPAQHGQALGRGGQELAAAVAGIVLLPDQALAQQLGHRGADVRAGQAAGGGDLGREDAALAADTQVGTGVGVGMGIVGRLGRAIVEVAVARDVHQNGPLRRGQSGLFQQGLAMAHQGVGHVDDAQGDGIFGAEMGKGVGHGMEPPHNCFQAPTMMRPTHPSIDQDQ